MKKLHVVCALANAGLLINGIDFVPHAQGVISAGPVPQEVADGFAAIPGYSVVEVEVEEKPEGKRGGRAKEPAVEKPGDGEAGGNAGGA